MTELARYLEIAADPQHLGSYYMVAKKLGIPPNSVYRARDTGGLADKHCFTIAEIINEDPLKVIAAKNTDVAKDEKAKSFWKTIAAGVVLSVAVGAPVESSQAEGVSTGAQVIKITGNRIGKRCNYFHKIKIRSPA